MRREPEKRIHDQGSGQIVEFAELDRGQALRIVDFGACISLAFSGSRAANFLARRLHSGLLSNLLTTGPGRRLATIVCSASHG